jgi:hypothetical protein
VKFGKHPPVGHGMRLTCLLTTSKQSTGDFAERSTRQVGCS